MQEMQKNNKDEDIQLYNLCFFLSLCSSFFNCYTCIILIILGYCWWKIATHQTQVYFHLFEFWLIYKKLRIAEWKNINLFFRHTKLQRRSRKIITIYLKKPTRNWTSTASTISENISAHVRTRELWAFKKPPLERQKFDKWDIFFFSSL